MDGKSFDTVLAKEKYNILKYNILFDVYDKKQLQLISATLTSVPMTNWVNPLFVGLNDIFESAMIVWTVYQLKSCWNCAKQHVHIRSNKSLHIAPLLKLGTV